MFRSYWIIAIALGLIATSSLGQAQEEGGNADRQAQAQDEPAKPLFAPFRVEIVENNAEAEARDRSEEESKEREIRDLAAQEGMNRATQAMNAATQDMRNFALYSTILTGVGTVLVFATLLLMIQANRAAVKAAEASEGAVAETRRIGEAQVRAYLGFEVAAGDVAANKRLSFTVKIINHGQSPAFEVATASTTFIRPSSWRWGAEPTNKPSGEATLAMLNPGGHMFIHAEMEPPILLTESHIGSLKSGISTAYASVTVFHKDVFGQSRETQFCFEFSGDRCFSTGDARISKTGNYEKLSEN
ncbi:hypothetical protein AB1K42_12890 [Roseibium algicola]|uniref:hypothetical protein n=1 Tax=Roseibium algicola TaxID=2857014 RepID=UPI003459B413